jgi:F0F1-type ATP synthase assembly protein I
MARSPSDRRGPSLSVIQSLAIASQFGITLAVSVVLGFFVGQWLDTRFGTGIIFSLIGVLIGLAAAASSTVRIYQGFLKRSVTTRSAPHQVDDDETDE